MNIIERLSFGFSRRVPMIRQTEATECGLACIAMIAGYHRNHTDLRALRQQFGISLKGSTLQDLLQTAAKIGFNTRPVKLEMDELKNLRMPCIIHWNFNHFVVLKKVCTKWITIHDPNQGVLKLKWNLVSKSFTGIAVELWPGADFRCIKKEPSLQFTALTGQLTGLFSSGAQILILAAALEVFTITGPLFLQWVIDNVIVSGDRELLTTLVVAFSLMMLMHEATSVMRTWVLLHWGTTLSVQWRANLFRHLLRIPVQYFQRRHLGDIVSRFGTTDHIQQTLTTSFLEGLIDGVMAIITVLMMILYSKTLAAITAIAMVLYAIIRWIWYAPLRQANEEQIIHAARQHSHFLETIRGITSIKLFQRQDERHSHWVSLMIEQINAELRTERLLILCRTANGLLFGAENILIVWLGASLVLDGEFSVGVLMAYIAYKGQFVSRMGALTDKWLELKMLQLHCDRLADIVLTEPEKEEVLSGVDFSDQSGLKITVRDLHFRYPGDDSEILSGVDFTIEPGESVAIIGPSGCGKTTLINVLLGALPVTSGHLLINEIPLEDYGIGRFRSLAATVMQEDTLFAGSITENISFFDAEADPEWVRQCARLAAIASDIEAMPMKYETLIGDMGTALSGGQKQRLLLARAFYKKPHVLFLDEATSHLDLGSEQAVNCAINTLGITRIIIAHRPETIASAGRVMVMVGGKITHDLPAQSAGAVWHIINNAWMGFTATNVAQK